MSKPLRQCPRCLHEPLDCLVGADYTIEVINVIIGYGCSNCESRFLTEAVDIEKAINFLMKNGNVISEADLNRKRGPDR